MCYIHTGAPLAIRVAIYDLRKTGTGGGASSGAGAAVGVCVWEHRLPLAWCNNEYNAIIYLFYWFSIMCMYTN